MGDRSLPRVRRAEDRFVGVLSVGSVILLWEIVARARLVNPLFTSSPSQVAGAAFEMFADGSIYEHLWVSSLEFAAGYGLAVAIGVPLGVMAGWSRRVAAALEPLTSAFYATPRIALFPLLLIWFGIGLGSKIAVVFLGAVLPVLVNAAAGVASADANLVRVARAFGATEREVLMTVALPASVPTLLAGMRLGVSQALVGIVVGEMSGASQGIGFIIVQAGARFQTDRLMAGVALIAAAGIGLNAALSRAERRFERWRTDANR
jgi:ABC-type nitrate/sulfonate/bicarbonate transport system permease component